MTVHNKSADTDVRYPEDANTSKAQWYSIPLPYLSFLSQWRPSLTGDLLDAPCAGATILVCGTISSGNWMLRAGLLQ